VKGVPGRATVPNLNYDNLVSEDTPELSHLSKLVKKCLFNREVCDKANYFII